MNNFARKYGAGLSVGCGLITAGVFAQLIFGAIDWGMTAWPVNGAIVCVFVIALFVMHLLRRCVAVFGWLGGMQSAVWSMAFAVVVTVALGLLRQSNHDDAPWHERLVSSWPFALVYAWLAVSLGMTVFRVGSRRWTWRTVAFMLNHAGLLTVLVAATLGNADMQRLRMMAGVASSGYEPQRFAYVDNANGHDVVEMDFSIELKEFIIEEQPQLKYISRIAVYGRDGSISIPDTVVEVNRPLSVDGWSIYQVGYDSRDLRYSIFELVRDPWIGAVYAGIFMMLAGAISLFFPSRPKS